MKYSISVIFIFLIFIQQASAAMIVKPRTWIESYDYMGNVKASKSILISSEIPGLIANTTVNSGQSVHAGQLLFQLRAEALSASLDKAKAILLDDQKNYERRRQLLPMHYISLADIDHLKAQVAEDKAELAHEQALFSQYMITAPFDGVLGIKQVEVGQYINAGQSLINLESIDLVYVDFAVPEKNLKLIKLGQAVTIKSDAFPNELLTGVISATSQAIDESNRSLMVRVSVPNPKKLLLTGMAVTVTIQSALDNQMIIPQSAIAYAPDGEGVYKIDANNTAHWQRVMIASRSDNQLLITKGIHFDDEISITGKPI